MTTQTLSFSKFYSQIHNLKLNTYSQILYKEILLLRIKIELNLFEKSNILSEFSLLIPHLIPLVSRNFQSNHE